MPALNIKWSLTASTGELSSLTWSNPKSESAEQISKGALDLHMALYWGIENSS